MAILTVFHANVFRFYFPSGSILLHSNPSRLRNNNCSHQPKNYINSCRMCTFRSLFLWQKRTSFEMCFLFTSDIRVSMLISVPMHVPSTFNQLVALRRQHLNALRSEYILLLICVLFLRFRVIIIDWGKQTSLRIGNQAPHSPFRAQFGAIISGPLFTTNCKLTVLLGFRPG